MKRYYANIAPGYGNHISHSDGCHGCEILADSIDDAELKLRMRAESEKWKGEILIRELNERGQQSWNAFSFRKELAVMIK